MAAATRPPGKATHGCREFQRWESLRSPAAPMPLTAVVSVTGGLSKTELAKIRLARAPAIPVLARKEARPGHTSVNGCFLV